MKTNKYSAHNNTATISYASGWKIKFPAHGLGPRLFLEWIKKKQHDNKKAAHPFVDFNITTEDDPAEVLNDLFVIKFENILREDVYECQFYINANS